MPELDNFNIESSINVFFPTGRVEVDKVNTNPKNVA